MVHGLPGEAGGTGLGHQSRYFYNWVNYFVINTCLRGRPHLLCPYNLLCGADKEPAWVGGKSCVLREACSSSSLTSPPSPANTLHLPTCQEPHERRIEEREATGSVAGQSQLLLPRLRVSIVPKGRGGVGLWKVRCRSTSLFECWFAEETPQLGADLGWVPPLFPRLNTIILMQQSPLWVTRESWTLSPWEWTVGPALRAC
jgi:hypothetical protein